MPIITISRGTLSGGEALARRLSEKLGYPAIGLEVIKDAATLYGISESEISKQLKKGPSLWERILGEHRRLYLIAVQSALAERALQGNFIYHGLAGHFLLQGAPNVLKVRLLAPLGYRVRSVMEKKKLNEEAAKKYIEKVDEQRKQWTRFLYNVDVTDPFIYDAVLNLEYMSLDTACEMIISAIHREEFKDTLEKQQAIRDFALVCQVKAKLAFSERTKSMEVEVEAKEGTVWIWGRVLTGKVFTAFGPFDTEIDLCKGEIIEMVQTVPGVEEVKVDLQEVPLAVE